MQVNNELSCPGSGAPSQMVLGRGDLKPFKSSSSSSSLVIACLRAEYIRDEAKTMYMRSNQVSFIVKKRNEKSYQVQAFCEERGLTPLLGVIW